MAENRIARRPANHTGEIVMATTGLGITAILAALGYSQVMSRLAPPVVANGPIIPAEPAKLLPVTSPTPTTSPLPPTTPNPIEVATSTPVPVKPPAAETEEPDFGVATPGGHINEPSPTQTRIATATPIVSESLTPDQISWLIQNENGYYLPDNNPYKYSSYQTASDGQILVAIGGKNGFSTDIASIDNKHLNEADDIKNWIDYSSLSPKIKQIIQESKIRFIVDNTDLLKIRNYSSAPQSFNGVYGIEINSNLYKVTESKYRRGLVTMQIAHELSRIWSVNKGYGIVNKGVWLSKEKEFLDAFLTLPGITPDDIFAANYVYNQDSNLRAELDPTYNVTSPEFAANMLRFQKELNDPSNREFSGKIVDNTFTTTKSYIVQDGQIVEYILTTPNLS